MTHQSETATDEPMRVTVFEHHDANAASRDVAIVRTHRWQFLTKEEATGTQRDLANMLLEAADLADEFKEFEIPLRTG